MRILLTSDLHLGMKFAGYPEVRGELSEERFRCLDRIIAEANRRGCDLLVVAGDLFERVGASRRDIERAAASVGRFGGKLAAILPGNHDYLEPDDELWRRFRSASGDRVLLLSAPRPHALEHFDLPGVTLYPAPCTAKHSASNAIGWVSAQSREARPGLAVGVAHGSVEGYSPDFQGEYYPMSLAELRDAGVRLWLLGHTHLPFTASPAPGCLLLCAGTPEPDGFDCRHGGSVTLVTIEGEGEPEVELIPTGAYRFRDETLELTPGVDAAALVRRYGSPDAKRTLLRLELEGSLSREERAALGELRKELERSLLFCDWRDALLRDRIERSDIDDEYPAGSFPHQLLTTLADSGDAEALQTAYELLEESRR